MRKDRYNYNYSPRTLKFLKGSNIIYFFLAWNAFGLCVYEWYSRGKDKESGWGRMSGYQKYLTMIKDPDEKVKVIKMKGITSVETEEISVDTFAAQDKRTQPSESSS